MASMQMYVCVYVCVLYFTSGCYCVENKWKTAFGLLQLSMAFSEGFHVLNRLKHLHDVFVFGEAYLGCGKA